MLSLFLRSLSNVAIVIVLAFAFLFVYVLVIHAHCAFGYIASHLRAGGHLVGCENTSKGLRAMSGAKPKG